jgi:hypothetical protein
MDILISSYFNPITNKLKFLNQNKFIRITSTNLCLIIKKLAEINSDHLKQTFFHFQNQ